MTLILTLHWSEFLLTKIGKLVGKEPIGTYHDSHYQKGSHKLVDISYRSSTKIAVDTTY